ncbi:hypothetical protein GCM10023193_17080 [Planotetraspora kaengkrachanensis]|uniref:Uncharacterized protein n=1 Tax=Planotetraspora kaengkrachanensis TaxID=575193 RepID=A0A8J3M8K4_9ACTN|nr:hypothetical protein Pka01_29420 [Planotetraspora kaengkrachanensis]
MTMPIQSNAGDSGTVRGVGNLALTVALLLIVLHTQAPRDWSALAIVVLAVIGVGLRIEAAISSIAAGRPGAVEAEEAHQD